MPPRKFARKKTNRERQLPLKEKMQEYGEILKTLGDCRMQIYCYDDKTRLGRVCGRIKRRTRIKVGDIVLISLRTYQDDKCDIIELYKEDEVKALRRMHEVPPRLYQDQESDHEQHDKLEIIFDDDFGIENVDINDI